MSTAIRNKNDIITADVSTRITYNKLYIGSYTLYFVCTDITRVIK